MSYIGYPEFDIVLDKRSIYCYRYWSMILYMMEMLGM